MALKAIILRCCETEDLGPAKACFGICCGAQLLAIALGGEARPSPVVEIGLTELSEEVNNEKTPVIVERIVNDIDEIVRYVRFDGWQNTHEGEREVKLPLPKTLFKYKLHQDQDLFERAYGYIHQYYWAQWMAI